MSFTLVQISQQTQDCCDNTWLGCSCSPQDELGQNFFDPGPSPGQDFSFMMIITVYLSKHSELNITETFTQHLHMIHHTEPNFLCELC